LTVSFEDPDYELDQPSAGAWWCAASHSANRPRSVPLGLRVRSRQPPGVVDRHDSGRACSSRPARSFLI